MSTWRGVDIASAFGITDDGLVLNGAFCLNTPLGLATPSLYRGNLSFLQWLGEELPQINTRLGRLGISRLLQAPSGKFYVKIADENVLLSCLETGPSCDPHNAFELFTVAAGVAHVHSQDVGALEGEAPNWLAYYRGQQDKLTQLKPPNLSRRALMAWSQLEETWRLCAEETIAMFSKQPSERVNCLILGLKSFYDFVYLPDRHQVHYNLVANCRLDSPAVDLAYLVASAGSDLRVATNMLLSYQRVRKITPLESRELLAHLWFPHEIDLALLADEHASPLSLQRASNLLRDKIGMISGLEDILLAPTEEAEEQREKEVLAVSRRPAKKVSLEEKVELPEPEVEEKVEVEEEQVVAQPEIPRIHMEATVTRSTTVWGPFPRPLGASAPPVEPTAEEMEVIDPEEEVLEADNNPE